MRARNAYARGGFCFAPFGGVASPNGESEKTGEKRRKSPVGLSAIPYFFVLSCAYTSIHVVSVPVVSAGASAGASVWVAWGITWSTAAENTDLNGA